MAFAAPGGRGEPDGSLGPPASPSGRRRSFAASGGSVRGCEAFHGLRSPRRADFRAVAADKASASACTVRDPHGSRWIGGSSRSVRRPCLSDETSAGLRRVGLGRSLRRRSRQSVCSGLRSPSRARRREWSDHRSRWIGGSSRSVRRPCLSDETSAGLRRVGLGHPLRRRVRSPHRPTFHGKRNPAPQPRPRGADAPFPLPCRARNPSTDEPRGSPHAHRRAPPRPPL